MGTQIVSNPFRVLDPNLGLTFKENTDFVKFNEGFHIGNTEQCGYFDLKPKSDNEFRIALVGNSYTLGQEVFERHHFRQTIKKRCNKVIDKEIKIINLGMMEYDLCDMYCRFKAFEEQVDADVVLVFVAPKDITCKDNGWIPEPVLVGEIIEVENDFTKREDFLKVLNRKNFIYDTYIWALLAKCRQKGGKGRWKRTLFGKLYSLFSKAPKESKLAQEIVFSDERLIPILNGFGSNSILVELKKFSENQQIVIDKSDISIIDMDPHFDQLRDKGIDPNYWGVTKKMGHFNHEAHRIIGAVTAQRIINNWEKNISQADSK